MCCATVRNYCIIIILSTERSRFGGALAQTLQLSCKSRIREGGWGPSPWFWLAGLRQGQGFPQAGLKLSLLAVTSFPFSLLPSLVSPVTLPYARLKPLKMVPKTKFHV